MAKKIGFMVMVAMLAVVYFTTDSNAAAGWYACRVDMTGPGGGTIYIQLTDKSASFTRKWFTAPADKAKEMLAVALTAMSNGLSVSVYVDTSIAGYPPIYSFYLTP